MVYLKLNILPTAFILCGAYVEGGESEQYALLLFIITTACETCVMQLIKSVGNVRRILLIDDIREAITCCVAYFRYKKHICSLSKKFCSCLCCARQKENDVHRYLLSLLGLFSYSPSFDDY